MSKNYKKREWLVCENCGKRRINMYKNLRWVITSENIAERSFTQKECILAAINTYKKHKSEDLASVFRSICSYTHREYVNKLGYLVYTIPEVQFNQLLLYEVQICIWLYAWADNGFPSIVLNEKTAASYAFADIPPEIFNDIRFPFNYFSISIPPVVTMNSKGIYVVRITISNHCDSSFIKIREETKAFYKSLSNTDLRNYDFLNIIIRIDMSNGEILWACCNYLSELFILNNEEYPLLEITDEDDRISLVSKKILINTIIALNSTDHYKKTFRTKKMRLSEESKKKTPIEIEEYRVTTPITVDFVKQVNSYINGKKEIVYKSRWIVRGHWRNQAFGKGMKEHRLKFIEPYWKGPEKGTVLIRPYQFKEKKRKAKYENKRRKNRYSKASNRQCIPKSN